MVEGFDKRGGNEVFSKSVRAGKRTYFFDVKATRANDLFLTITESKKSFDENGNASFQKHKIFLYKEDFEKFAEGLRDTLSEIEKVKENYNDSSSSIPENTNYNRLKEIEKDINNISFEDL